MKEQEMKKVMVLNLAKEVKEGKPVKWLDQEEVKKAISDVLDINIDGYIREMIIHRDYISGIMKKTLHDITIRKIEAPFSPEQIEKLVQEMKL